MDTAIVDTIIVTGMTTTSVYTVSLPIKGNTKDNNHIIARTTINTTAKNEQNPKVNFRLSKKTFVKDLIYFPSFICLQVNCITLFYQSQIYFYKKKE